MKTHIAGHEGIGLIIESKSRNLILSLLVLTMILTICTSKLVQVSLEIYSVDESELSMRT